MLEGFCGECVVEIPIRSKHCKYCRKCVAMYDHHCDWIGNCVGEKNKPLFLIFVFCHCLEILFSIIIVKYKNNDQTLGSFNLNEDSSSWMKSNILLFINLILECLFFVFVNSLLIYHISLLWINQSTCKILFIKGKIFAGIK